MTSLALKSLWARKARAFSTTVAVVIGVAFMAGSYVLTDTIFAAFDDIFSESLAGTSVVVTAQNPVEQESGEIATVPRSYLPKVQGGHMLSEYERLILEADGLLKSADKRELASAST